MKSLRNMLPALLATLVVVTMGLTVFTHSVQAVVNPAVCRCNGPVPTTPTVGEWKTMCYNTEGKEWIHNTDPKCVSPDLCPKSGASGACNPLTDAVVNGPFPVPTLGDLLGSLIKIFFFIAGLMSLLYLLLGAFEWVRSGGKEEDIEGAQKKIMAAIIGLIVMVAVLTLVIVIEQVIFRGTICLGISCPFKLGDIGIVSPN
ncbi:MAG: hypothetical protein WCJ70_04560 [bacterium]